MINDILYEILSFAKLNDVIICLTVSKQFNYVINERWVWNRLCKRDYDTIYRNATPNEYHKKYEMCYSLDMLQKQHFRDMPLKHLFNTRHKKYFVCHREIKIITKGIQLLNPNRLSFSMSHIHSFR